VGLGQELLHRDGGVGGPWRAEDVESVLRPGSSAYTTGWVLTSRSRVANLRACSTGIRESFVPCNTKNGGAWSVMWLIGELRSNSSGDSRRRCFITRCCNSGIMNGCNDRASRVKSYTP
jgi:hypothetical protein